MECLDANAVQDLMSGALDGSARGRAIAHLDGCDDCRELLALLARDAARDAAVSTLGETQISAADHRRVAELGLLSTAHGAPLGKRAEPVSMAGKTLGRYALTARLGAGAMGVVYRADDAGLGRQVALKLLHRPDEALRERLVREARSMAQVNHPNVVAVYDVGVADGLTYIAMELVDGDSLRRWQQQPRPIAELVSAYVTAGRGLAAAHAAGIVHRDFKPDNCLVGGGRADRVKVTDFGLAAARASEVRVAPGDVVIDDSLLTASGSILGTPAYMAPEQFAGGNVDPRTDQFNFCVALYEALYGARPFAGKTFAELGASVRGGAVRPVPAGSRVSGALRAIVLRGLSVRPGDRFPTMDHLLARLARDRARPWRWTWIAAAALAAALALGLFADAVVRDRVTAEIRESFELTARQTNRAWDGLTARFDTSANQVYTLSVLREMSSNRDQADFGLGAAETDATNLDRIHSALASQDWTLAQDFAGTQYPMTIAVADYKGRMMFSTAAPSAPRADLLQLPWITAALTQRDRSISLVRTDEPALVKTGLLGPEPPLGLDFVYTRTLLLGNGKTREATGAFIEAVDAARLFGEIRLDERTLLSIVADDGTAIGDVPAGLVRLATTHAGISSAEARGAMYQVLAQPIRGFDNQVVGNVVMARRLDSVLRSVFPGARRMFELALLATLLLAALAALRARQISHA
ncbi:MAG TPA: protein kinase [Kofleriaceae bacterium]